MKAITEMREAAKSGGAMNEAMRRYLAESGPYLSQRGVVFAQLALHYLQWTANLLAKLQAAAEARPAAGGAVKTCLERIDAYFETPDRWPSVDRLDHPLRSLIPAYYAMRAAQRASGSFKPPLLELSCDEPHAVLIELLGRGACQTVSEHKNADLRTLPKLVESEGDYRPLPVRSFPSASERAALDGVRNHSTPEPGPRPAVNSAPPSPPIVQEDRSSAWVQRLAGTRIVLEQTNSDPDYSGSSYYSRESYLDLFTGGTYRLTTVTTSRISYAGMSLGGPSHREEWGSWTIVASGGTTAVLRLADETGGATSYAISAGSGGLTVDGRERSWSG
jgi:hypothetical protein